MRQVSRVKHRDWKKLPALVNKARFGHSAGSTKAKRLSLGIAAFKR